jgi:hypothetical protein
VTTSRKPVFAPTEAEQDDPPASISETNQDQVSSFHIPVYPPPRFTIPVFASTEAEQDDPPPLFPILPVESRDDRLDIDDDELNYRTNPFIWQEIPDSGEEKFHEIWPAIGDSWKYDEFLVILNELLVGYI